MSQSLVLISLAPCPCSAFTPISSVMERFEYLISKETALCLKSQQSRLKYQLKNYSKGSLDSQIVLAWKYTAVSQWNK